MRGPSLVDVDRVVTTSDVKPVPLCLVCWFQILDNARRRVDPTALIDGADHVR